MSKKTVIHLGISGFPFGFAPIQRVRLVFKALQIGGLFPLVISKNSPHSRADLKKTGRHDGIPYLYTSKKIRRPDNFVARNLNKVSGYAGELAVLFKKRKKIIAAILYTPSFYELVYYRVVSTLFRFKLVIQYVEFRSSIADRKDALTILNDRMFDRYSFFFCDGVIAISDFLRDHVASRSGRTPVIKVPAINDFDTAIDTPAKEKEPYLMYCGTIDYLEVIEFILDIFSALKKRGDYGGRLLLIISGSNPGNRERLRSHLAQMPFADSVDIKSSIKYEELLSFYGGADLLMIPLRDSIQDRARFPHKIGEYTASKRPILSTNVGEMSIYFKDGVSAILANEYSIEAYVKTLSGYLTSGDLSDIGINGYQVGIAHFHYACYAKSLVDFVSSLS